LNSTKSPANSTTNTSAKNIDIESSIFAVKKGADADKNKTGNSTNSTAKTNETKKRW